jgi:hypothetical protein
VQRGERHHPGEGREGEGAKEGIIYSSHQRKELYIHPIRGRNYIFIPSEGGSLGFLPTQTTLTSEGTNNILCRTGVIWSIAVRHGSIYSIG